MGHGLPRCGRGMERSEIPEMTLMMSCTQCKRVLTNNAEKRRRLCTHCMYPTHQTYTEPTTPVFEFSNTPFIDYTPAPTYDTTPSYDPPSYDPPDFGGGGGFGGGGSDGSW